MKVLGMAQGGRRPSMADVARAAGVSPQTVSRVSNGERYVTPELRERVQSAMRTLGYRPNSAARAMKRGSFRTIGAVFHSLHQVGNHRALEAICERAAERGYATTLLPLAASTPQDADGAFTRLGEMGVDAVIWITSSRLMGDTALQLPGGLPTVVLGPSAVASVGSVNSDAGPGTAAAITQLLRLGHETVHHLSGPADSLLSQAREDVWRSILARNGRRVPGVLPGDWTPESGYCATRELLASGEAPTALFAGNDQMALGAFRAILDAGLRIPQDISVVGFDDIDEAASFPTPLTTVAQEWDELGEAAVRIVLDMLGGGPPSHVTVPTRLVQRDSTAPPPDSDRHAPVTA